MFKPSGDLPCFWVWILILLHLVQLILQCLSHVFKLVFASLIAGSRGGQVESRGRGRRAAADRQGKFSGQKGGRGNASSYRHPPFHHYIFSQPV
jgi:hypothetical protein